MNGFYLYHHKTTHLHGQYNVTYSTFPLKFRTISFLRTWELSINLLAAYCHWTFSNFYAPSLLDYSELSICSRRIFTFVIFQIYFIFIRFMLLFTCLLNDRYLFFYLLRKRIWINICTLEIHFKFIVARRLY
jgi:hypothetical protein